MSTSQASWIARFGRRFTGEELMFWVYLDSLEQWGVMPHNPNTPLAKLFETLPQSQKDNLEKSRLQLEECLALSFIQAVQTYDSEKIIKMAEAVWFLKTVKNRPLYDQKRFDILKLKYRLFMEDKKMEIREVARLMGEKSSGQDGFAALRRLCKEVDFPLAKSRRGRRKKAT